MYFHLPIDIQNLILYFLCPFSILNMYLLNQSKKDYLFLNENLVWRNVLKIKKFFVIHEEFYISVKNKNYNICVPSHMNLKKIYFKDIKNLHT